MKQFMLTCLLLGTIAGAQAVDSVTPEYIAPRVATRPVQAYLFKHEETTGITSAILVDGKWVSIQFSPDSDARARKLLYALKWEVFLPNANQSEGGGGIFLVGQLYDGISHTASAPNMAMSEPFHEFTLQRWYIVAPIRERLYLDDNPLEYLKTNSRKRLRKSDFREVQPTDAELADIHRK